MDKNDYENVLQQLIWMWEERKDEDIVIFIDKWKGEIEKANPEIILLYNNYIMAKKAMENSLNYLL